MGKGKERLAVISFAVHNLRSVEKRTTNRVTHLQPVLPTIPLHRGSEVLDRPVDPLVPAELLVIRGEDDLVLSSPVGPDAVVGERVGRVEVEDEEEVASLKDDHFVGLDWVPWSACEPRSEQRESG